MDGWEDDDDLDLGLDDDPQDTPTTAPTPAMTTMAAAPDAGGWEDDDDLFGEDGDVENTQVRESAVPQLPVAAPTPAAMTAHDNGWDEDDDLNFDDDEEEETLPAPTAALSTTVTDNYPNDNAFGAGFQLSTQPTVGASNDPQPDAEDGWDDDDDLNFDDDDDNLATENERTPGNNIDPSPAAPASTVMSGGSLAFPPAAAPDALPAVGAASQEDADGWSDNDDDLNFDDDEEGADKDPISESMPSGPDLRKQLEDYVSSLGRMASSINAVLDFEYNTPEKAQELVQYYTDRPGLAEYTRTKELSRMNYQVVLPGKVETSKEAIAANFLPDDSLLARCANQSLLADLIQVLTGPDLVVRPQFFAVCVAQTCQFRLHMGDGGRDMVQCNCILQLSLPKEDGSRLNVATIRTTVVFSPLQAIVKFKVDKIIVTLKDMTKLEGVVQFLNMMEMENMGFPAEEFQQDNEAADQYRDFFLVNAQEHTQKIVHQSKAGMKSALKDMESVLGLKSKFKAVQGGISKFLPTTDHLLAVEEEARALALQREQEHQRGRAFPPPAGMNPPPVELPAHAFPRPPPAAPPLQQPMPFAQPSMRQQTQAGVPRPPLPPTQPTDASRPKSILSGLVSSGWSALAKSVTLPDEDPAIYGSGHATAASAQQPALYRREEPTPPQKQATAFPRPVEGHGVEPPQQATPPSSTTNPLQSEKLQHSLALEEMVEPPNDDFGDGWDDDLDLDVSNEVTPEPTEDQTNEGPLIPQNPPTQSKTVAESEKEDVMQTLGESSSDSHPAKNSQAVETPHIGDEYDWGAENDSQNKSEMVGEYDWDASEQEVEHSETTGQYDWNDKVEDGGDDTDNLGEYDWGQTDPQVDDSETGAASEPESAPVSVVAKSTEVIVPESDSEQEDLSTPVAADETAATSDLDTGISQTSAVGVNEKLPTEPVPPVARRSIMADIPYNQADDIIPTRKRWINPRPNRPYVIL